MRKTLIIALTCIGLGGMAEVQVTEVTAQQRYPWNGKVDIRFTVSGATATADHHSYGAVTLRVKHAQPQVNTISCTAVTLDGQACSGGTGYLSDLNGTHTFVWDSSLDAQNQNASLVYEVSLQQLPPIPSDNTGNKTGIIRDVMTVNLSNGEVHSYSKIDTGTFNCLTYKQTKMAFVKVPLGAYKVGTSAQYTATFTQDYYIGIFEVTREQYKTVTGSDTPNSWASTTGGTMSPAHDVSWDTIMADGGFMQTVNTLLASANSSATMSLPTEAQWEVAARAGTTTKWFFGSSSSQLGTYAWYSGNQAKKADGSANSFLQLVGSKSPNPWGIYDIYGNAWEWCADYTGGTYWGTDPTGGTSGNRVYRGGGPDAGADTCSSIQRQNKAGSTHGWPDGFRAVLHP